MFCTILTAFSGSIQMCGSTPSAPVVVSMPWEASITAGQLASASDMKSSSPAPEITTAWLFSAAFIWSTESE
jgi:hypothetical protein